MYVATYLMAKVDGFYDVSKLMFEANEYAEMFLYGTITQVVQGPMWDDLYQRVLTNQKSGWGLTPMLHYYWDYYNNYTCLLPCYANSFIWFDENRQGVSDPPDVKQWYQKVLHRGSVRWAELLHLLTATQIPTGAASKKQLAVIPFNSALSWWMTQFCDGGPVFAGKKVANAVKNLYDGRPLTKHDMVYILELIMVNFFEKTSMDDQERDRRLNGWVVMDEFCILADLPEMEPLLQASYNQDSSSSNTLKMLFVLSDPMTAKATSIVLQLKGPEVSTVNLNSAGLKVVNLFLFKELSKGRAYTFVEQKRMKNVPVSRDAALAYAIGMVGFQYTYAKPDATYKTWQRAVMYDVSGDDPSSETCRRLRLFLAGFVASITHTLDPQNLPEPRSSASASASEPGYSTSDGEGGGMYAEDMLGIPNFVDPLKLKPVRAMTLKAETLAFIETLTDDRGNLKAATFLGGGVPRA